jgi:hypothetical protein
MLGEVTDPMNKKKEMKLATKLNVEWFSTENPAVIITELNKEITFHFFNSNALEKKRKDKTINSNNSKFRPSACL